MYKLKRIVVTIDGYNLIEFENGYHFGKHAPFRETSSTPLSIKEMIQHLKNVNEKRFIKYLPTPKIYKLIMEEKYENK